MANAALFSSAPRGEFVPVADTKNNAGGVAYTLSQKEALAQLASTGCFGNTFYVTAEDQLKTVLELSKDLDATYIAQVAIHARERAYMKDMPALLCAILATKDVKLLEKVFPRIINNVKMLRNFVQIMRSGVVGRKSLGTVSKRLVQNWINNANYRNLLNGSVGNDPSLADIIKMVHPKPADEERKNFYAWLIGREYDFAKLPEIVKQFEYFKAGEGDVPDVEFRLLTSHERTKTQWEQIALNLPVNALRMNLNTLGRHGVLTNPDIVQVLEARLMSAELVSKAKIMPFQLLTSILNTDRTTVPDRLSHALTVALNNSAANFPVLPGRVGIFMDISGSMSSNYITGARGKQSTVMTAGHVAALMVASIYAKNPDAHVRLFHEQLFGIAMPPLSTPAANTQLLIGALRQAGTNIALPMAQLVEEKIPLDLIIYVSDNESWIDSPAASPSGLGGYARPETARLWGQYKASVNSNAKMVCIDLTPNTTSQLPQRKDVLNIGGFTDEVIRVIEDFAKGEFSSASAWVEHIEKISLD